MGKKKNSLKTYLKKFSIEKDKNMGSKDRPDRNGAAPENQQDNYYGVKNQVSEDRIDEIAPLLAAGLRAAGSVAGMGVRAAGSVAGNIAKAIAKKRIKNKVKEKLIGTKTDPKLERDIDKDVEQQVSEKCWPGYEKKGMKTMFGKRYPNCVKKKAKLRETMENLDEEGLRAWFGNSRSKGGKPGWVQVVSGKPCARQPGQKTTPKCVSSSKRASMTPAERRSAQARKRRADPNQPQKSGAAKPTYVPTDKPERKSK